MHLQIRGGDFFPHDKSRFSGKAFVLYAPEAVSLRATEVRYPAASLATFQVHEGAWEKFLADGGDYMRAMKAAALFGTPAAVANIVLPDFIPGQKGLITWANALIGGVAAAHAVKSSREVAFTARFEDGLVLKATAEERKLTAQMPKLLTAALARSALPAPAPLSLIEQAQRLIGKF